METTHSTERISIKQYNEFYRKNRRAIFNHINMRVRDVATSEELTNDVFIKVYQHFNKFDSSKSAFKTWVYNIAKNGLIDYFRKKKLNTLSMYQPSNANDSDSVIESMEFNSFEADPLHAMIANENQDKINEAIQTLPVLQKTVLTKYAMGHTYDEIASELGIPMGTIKAALFTARSTMRELFGKVAMAA